MSSSAAPLSCEYAYFADVHFDNIGDVDVWLDVCEGLVARFEVRVFLVERGVVFEGLWVVFLVLKEFECVDIYCLW